MIEVVLIGPTSSPIDVIGPEIEADLKRLDRPGLALHYRTTGAGPAAVQTADDAARAAPHVVGAVKAAAADGFDGVVVDCTDDPGVAEADRVVGIPVVGAGQALREAIAGAERPVVELSGDDLRRLSRDELAERVDGAATVALGGTGFSDLGDHLAQITPGIVILDPLVVALDLCLSRLAG